MMTGHGRCREYKHDSPLHELLFCVEQDQPLKLPYGRIVSKGTLPLCELLVCVEHDNHLKLPYGRIACKST